MRILAVANPTADLAVAEATVSALSELGGKHGSFSVEVTALTCNKATRARFAELLARNDFDILHFAGHASLDQGEPGMSALYFADGVISANDVLRLPWKVAPHLVFNSACESGRALGGRRLVSTESQSKGLAAAFLAIGAFGYAGYFWPVTDAGAGLFTKAFYGTLFRRENVGLAFLEARRSVTRELGDVGDLTGYSAVLFGDAASQHRRDWAMAV